ncbi:SDR family oxidoreductase [Mucilaginibacter sp. PAMB04274]|uniref:SDR family oxidoreductase n=1 Tax=Mucilaginibacter sp. PAMB04274 TaxID=3138568 RepID=UPI0031F696A2
MISILGCGWYGLALAKALLGEGELVKGSTTSEARLPDLTQAGIKPYIVSVTEEGTAQASGFFETDTLIVCIPPKFRSGQTAAYLSKMENIIAAAINHNIGQAIYISSTGVYPDNNQVVDESVLPEPDEASSAHILFAAEQLFMKQTAFKTTIIRFGGLVGPGRHPGRFFAGKIGVDNGRAPVNLIHLDDCIQITLSVLKQQAYGFTFNACSPSHPQKQVFYTQAAMHAELPLPQFKDELNDWKTVNSINLGRILNYKFIVGDWKSCFAENKF